MMMRNQTPRPKTPSVHLSVKEPVQVYCRMRPLLNETEISCLKKVSPYTVQMISPQTAVNFRDGCFKETLYSFSSVFDENANQNTVFENVALPLVCGFLHGKNGLLFTYGITGSGKTYTMTGTPQACGIMPRALDVIFNSINHLQAKRFVFKPDRLNGFEVQSEEDAKKEELQTQANKNLKTPRAFRSEWINRSAEKSKLEGINEDNLYAVFVTYVEIYNNSVYDLLDENFEELSIKYRGPQSKMVREDAAKNMYVHGCTEVEVKSMEEAFEVFNKGVSRKRMAHNSLNAESSRSHSVFTVRLVQAPLDLYGENILSERTCISISQLSFVDLAGGERTSRTNTSGQRLREAGNINNSLMNLRTCLEILRENQTNGTNKLVPYRDSKLTHLFKNFFDGACAVRVIVCVNPRSEDYDENIHVMKFAEMSQDVQVSRPTPLRTIDNLPSGRRRANQIFKQAMANLNDMGSNRDNIPVEVGVPVLCSLASQFPDLCLKGPEDEKTLKNIMLFLEVEIAKKKKFELEVETKYDELRKHLVELENELNTMMYKNNLLSADLELEKEKVAIAEAQLVTVEVASSNMKKQIDGFERIIKRLQEEIQEKDHALSKRLQDRQREKQRYQSKFAQTAEKMNHQMEIQLIDQKRKLELEMRRKDKKLRDMKRILSDEALTIPTTSAARPCSFNIGSESTESLSTALSLVPPSTVTTRKKQLNQTPQQKMYGRTPAVSNPRHRRSRSVSDDHWLEHRSETPVPLNTVMQPVLKKRKSITKLTDIKDVANSKTSKYCLMMQEQDSEGDLETHLYKGDVVPTCGGGAQVILNDVEILKQKSPTSSPTRKRSGNADVEAVEDKCMISLEGHAKRSKR